MSKIDKRRAASLKARRTRSRMKKARQMPQHELEAYKKLWDEKYNPHANWPAWMKRALPPPKFDR